VRPGKKREDRRNRRRSARGSSGRPRCSGGSDCPPCVAPNRPLSATRRRRWAGARRGGEVQEVVVSPVEPLARAVEERLPVHFLFRHAQGADVRGAGGAPLADGCPPQVLLSSGRARFSKIGGGAFRTSVGAPGHRTRFPGKVPLTPLADQLPRWWHRYHTVDMCCPFSEPPCERRPSYRYCERLP